MLHTADILGSTQSTTSLLNTRTLPKGSCCRTFPQLSTPLELTESTIQISLYFHTSPGRLPGPWHLGVSLAGEIHPLRSPVNKEDKTTFTPTDSPTDQNIAKLPRTVHRTDRIKCSLHHDIRWCRVMAPATGMFERLCNGTWIGWCCDLHKSLAQHVRYTVGKNTRGWS